MAEGRHKEEEDKVRRTPISGFGGLSAGPRQDSGAVLGPGQEPATGPGAGLKKRGRRAIAQPQKVEQEQAEREQQQHKPWQDIKQEANHLTPRQRTMGRHRPTPRERTGPWTN